MYEDWLDPSTVRKLSNLEIIKGLSGPVEPITQQDFDQSTRTNRGRDGRGRGGSNYDRDLRQSLMDSMRGASRGGGGGRNRRQDRTANRYSQRGGGYGYDSESARNERNWNWYQDQQQQRQRRGGTSGVFENDNWAMEDVDSQWGRSSYGDNNDDRNYRGSASGRGRGGSQNRFQQRRGGRGETDDRFDAGFRRDNDRYGYGNRPRQQRDNRGGRNDNYDNYGRSNRGDDRFATRGGGRYDRFETRGGGRYDRFENRGGGRYDRFENRDGRGRRGEFGGSDGRWDRNRGESRQRAAAVDGSGDWSSFVTPSSSAASASSSSRNGGDRNDEGDFFSSLIGDLSSESDRSDGGAGVGAGASL